MIVIENLIKRHGAWEVLHGVSLETRPGRVIGFMGLNGTRKSSTLRCLLGLNRADGGRAFIGGHTYCELHESLHTVGAVLDGSSMYPSRTARSHPGQVTSGAGVSRHRVAEVLDAVGLGKVAGRRMRILFLGVGQHLGLATTLLSDPEVLVLDGPADSLDPEGIRWIRRLLRQQADVEDTVLLFSHVLAELAEVADDVVVIVGGRVRAAGTLEGVAAGHTGLEEASFSLTTPAGGTAGGGAGQAGRAGRADRAGRAGREGGSHS